MSGERKVVIVGAGLVGLACAYALAESGYELTVVDDGEPGTGASWGNGGLVALAPSLVAPIPEPRLIGTSIGWLLTRRGPLRIAPRLEWDYVRWLAAFAASCSENAARAGLEATLALNAETERLFDALSQAGLEFEMERRGLLIVYRSDRSFEHARRQLANGNKRATVEILTRNEALEAEPLLHSHACRGAIFYEADRQVRPDTLLLALIRRLTAMGVEIRANSPCLKIERQGATVVGIHTPSETLYGDAYVLAAGTGVAKLAKQVGARIPVEAGKGYSFDFPRDELPLRVPVYIHGGRLVVTPFRDFTRVVGMMEVGARDMVIRSKSLATMHRLGAAAFADWPRHAVTPWAGLRPIAPDGLPIIGAVPGLANLYVAAGHGMLGLTLSLRTGSAIASCLRNGDASDPTLWPFAPSRFSR